MCRCALTELEQDTSQCVFKAVMYNSISMDMVVGPVAKVEKIEDQMEQFVDYAKNFGVPQVMENIKLAKINCRL